MNQYVLGFIYSTAEDVVLLQKSANRMFPIRWNGIVGHIEEGEEPNHAMIRESMEEIGFSFFTDWKHKITYICPGGIVYIFVAKFESQLFVPELKDKTEKQPIQWFKLNDIPEDCNKNIRWMIPLCNEPLLHPAIIHATTLGI